MDSTLMTILATDEASLLHSCGEKIHLFLKQLSRSKWLFLCLIKANWNSLSFTDKHPKQLIDF